MNQTLSEVYKFELVRHMCIYMYGGMCSVIDKQAKQARYCHGCANSSWCSICVYIYVWRYVCHNSSACHAHKMFRPKDLNCHTFDVLNCRLLFHLTFTSLTPHHALYPVLSRLLFHLTFTALPCDLYYIVFALVHLMGTN